METVGAIVVRRSKLRRHVGAASDGPNWPFARVGLVEVRPADVN